MQSIRPAIQDENECGRDVIFHLLIPAWCSISISKPLHFPDALQPFYIEGQIDGHKAYVTFNLPTTPRGLLNNVNNTFDPNLKQKGLMVCLAVGITTLCIGSGVITGLNLWVALPIYWGTAGIAVYFIRIQPRILGNEKLLQV